MSTDHYLSWRYVLSFSGINYAQAALSAALTFLLVQFVSIQSFAEYRLGVVCMGIVTTVGVFGADRSLVTELTRASSARDTAVAYFVIRFVVAVLSLIVVVAFAGTQQDASLGLVLVFGLAGLLMALRSPGWFDYVGRLRQHATLMLTERALAFAISTAVVISWPNVTAFFLGLIVLGTVLTELMIELAIIRKNISLGLQTLSAAMPRIKGLLRRQQWVWYLSISNLLMTFVAQFVLYLRGADVELAYLGVAMQFATISMLFMQQLARVRGPAIAKITENDLNRSQILSAIGKFLPHILIIGIILGLLVGSVAGTVLSIFFDGKYAPAIPVSWILMVWIVALGIGLLINRFIIGFNLQAYVFIPSIFWGILCLIMVFLLSENYGALGYAWILLGCHSAAIFCQFLILIYYGGVESRLQNKQSERAKTHP